MRLHPSSVSPRILATITVFSPVPTWAFSGATTAASTGPCQDRRLRACRCMTWRSIREVTGNGEVDAVRYGSILRARRLVGVRGVGFSYNGLYYVRRVTHNIEPGKYTQSFTLSREGTGRSRRWCGHD